MARRRMFSIDVTETDKFLDLPSSAQALYFHIGMSADDDGFVSSPRRIAATCGSSVKDLEVLIKAGYLIRFDSGVCVVTHWNISNRVQRDRYHETAFKEERANLVENESGVYVCIQNVSKMDTEVKLGKVSLGEVNPIEANQIEANLIEERGRENDGADLSQSGEATPAAPPVILLPLNTGGFYPVTQEQVDQWRELYPNVDVQQALRCMRGWLDANPKRRKTKSGIQAFIVRWLAKEQDRGGTVNQRTDNTRRSWQELSQMLDAEEAQT